MALPQLNQPRRTEEAAGLVRWLRPDYQTTRYGRHATRPAPQLRLVAGAAPQIGRRPLYPRDRDERSAAVLQVLAQARTPLDLAGIAGRFRNGAGRRTKAQIEATLIVLAQYGHISLLPDGRYLARRAA